MLLLSRIFRCCHKPCAQMPGIFHFARTLNTPVLSMGKGMRHAGEKTQPSQNKNHAPHRLQCIKSRGHRIEARGRTPLLKCGQKKARGQVCDVKPSFPVHPQVLRKQELNFSHQKEDTTKSSLLARLAPSSPLPGRVPKARVELPGEERVIFPHLAGVPPRRESPCSGL